LEAFLQDWGYLGIFLGIVATGLGFPMPEELPVVVAGIMAGHNLVYWWLMLPVCIVAVIIGDSCLYWIGRLWGPRLIQYKWIRRHLLTPERLASIERNFHEYGIRILLFARMTPGIRAPIFVTAGIIRLSVPRFVIADGLYAVPGVSFLFFLGWWFGNGILALVERAEHVKFWIMLVLMVAVGGYFAYRFLRKPVLTGDPKEMPPLVGSMTNRIDHMATMIMHPIKGHPPAVAPPLPPTEDGQPDPAHARPSEVAERQRETSGP
jgi:membrane protein DedA with SNARE-associated domain